MLIGADCDLMLLAIQHDGERNVFVGRYLLGLFVGIRLYFSGHRCAGGKAFRMNPVGGHAGINQCGFGSGDHGFRSTDEHLIHASHGQQGGNNRAHLVTINPPL